MWHLWWGIIYIGLGLLIAFDHVVLKKARGAVGALGTFMAVALFWPFLKFPDFLDKWRELFHAASKEAPDHSNANKRQSEVVLVDQWEEKLSALLKEALDQSNADKRQSETVLVDEWEEKLYAFSAAEVEEDAASPGLMAKALADSEGDAKKASALYIRMRVAQLKQQPNRSTALVRLWTEKVEEERLRIPGTKKFRCLSCRSSYVAWDAGCPHCGSKDTFSVIKRTDI